MNPSWLKNHDVRSFAFKPIIVRTYCTKPVCDVALRLPMRELPFEIFFMKSIEDFQFSRSQLFITCMPVELVIGLLSAWFDALKDIFRHLGHLSIKVSRI